MGMFDGVLVPCPECGTPHEAQSKSGDCTLRNFNLGDAPAEVLADINRHAPFTCERCGTLFAVEVQCIAIPRRFAHPDADE